jgi:putative DNA primase/helicase
MSTIASDALESFRAVMHGTGLSYGGLLIPDGHLRRFKAEGDHGRNSWYVLHAGPPLAGAFGCWKRGITETWCEHNGSLSESEQQYARERWHAAKREREQVETELRTKAQKTAVWILERTKPATAHAYLAAKGVKVFGDVRNWNRALVLPLRDTDGKLHSLQFIFPDADKRFLTGGRIAGCFFMVADNSDGALVICEGYATGASIHQATGLATVAAISAGNLLAVAKAFREKFPVREIIIAADDDAWTQGNPGLSKAREAALAVRARLVLPQFPDLSRNPTDFNDLAALAGIAEVKQQIERAALANETDEETFVRLATLPPVKYDRCRKQEAVRLGIRPATLDAEVLKYRPHTEIGEQGSAVEFPNVEPWGQAVNGAQLLSDVANTFSRYLALPPGAADALALWTSHAHEFEAFTHTPRLDICSPDKGCGKTTALDVTATMTPRALRTESITAAVLFRLVEQHKPTLLLDEVDAYLNDAEELRGLLNAGHKRGAKAYRCEGENNTVRGFTAFAPAALAGIGALPGTLHDRSIIVRLARAKAGEVPARFDSRRIQPETDLCRKLARWAADNFDSLKNCDPQLPETAFNRLADNWRPLFAIAEIAGGNWPKRAADAFARLTSAEDLDAQGIGTTLLADIAAIFTAEGTDRLASAKLAESLTAIEGRPWAEWGKHRKPISPNQLANQLRRFDVSPDTIRIGDETPRGYLLTDFQEAFDRYLPRPPLPECNTATTLVETSILEVQQPKSVLHPENSSVQRECCSVAVQKEGETGIVKPQRPLAERERAILARNGAEHDPIIIEALNLFNARIVE